MGVGGQRHAPAAFTPGKDPVPIVQKAGWSWQPVWIAAENLALTGIRFPELPARSEYRLRHPGCTTYIDYLRKYLRSLAYDKILHACLNVLEVFLLRSFPPIDTHTASYPVGKKALFLDKSGWNVKLTTLFHPKFRRLDSTVNLKSSCGYFFTCRYVFRTLRLIKRK